MEAKEENRSPGATTDHILLKQPPERREEGVVDHGSRAAAATAGDEWGHTSSSAAHGSNRTGPDAPPEDLQFNRSRHASVVDVPPEELEGIWTPGVTQQEPLPAHGHTGGLVPGDEGDEVPEEVDEEAWLASHGGAESLALQEVLQGWGVRRRGSVGDAQMLTQKEILAAVKEIKEEREEKQRHEDTLCCLFVCPPRWWDPSLFRWLLKEFHSVACLFNDSVAYPWTRMNKTAFFWWLVWLHMGVAALLYFPYDSENEFNKHDAVMSSRIEVAQSDPCRSDTYRFQCPMEEGEWSGRDIILILWAAAAATFVSKILVFFGFWLPLPFDEMSRALHLTPEEKEDEYIRLFLVPLSAKSHVRARELALGFFWVLTGAIFLGVFGFSFFATSVFNPWMKIAFVWPSDATYSDIQSSERHSWCCCSKRRAGLRIWRLTGVMPGSPEEAEMFRQRKVKRAAREKECGERCQQFLCCTRCRQDKASSASSVRTGGRGGRRWPWRRGRGRGQPSTLVEVRPASPDRQRSAQPDFETEMEEGRRLASGTNQQPGNAWAAEESRVAESEGGGVLERSEMNAQGMSRQETAWEREQFRRENQNADDQELRGETAAEKAGGTAEGEEEEGAGDVEERYGEVMGQLEQIAAALKAPAPPVRPPPQP
uniref:Uncharacterized protein n=1 Tax=Chromera velia CCMP2878 TaxID=1169474 RepID=A0A0K6SB70_9ALVE|eukprot:Cvel_2036.t2-p1 / transcript=Cvel_2036.t2 / gene=Cvel_2036 / organism=Chromera_velia_CCMP2878 / gene_product=Prestalk protein, putative / transcript_product=Prestalk protein, putative / location=Cvel_scaffold78:28143-32308(-) / protein_length=653 / sequence_SO=supercontig / SO=protein_coding / is_pseudo=false